MSNGPGGPPVWREEFKLRSYQVDFRKRATLETICRIFGEVAWNHAEALGVGFEKLHREGKAWALSRLVVRVHEYPRWGEAMEATTWPRPTQGVFAMRDFEMKDARGRLTASGSSSWIVLDLESRRPQRMDKILGFYTAWTDRQAAGKDPEKLRDGPLPEAPCGSVQVKYSDLDVNGHVNNARYVSWLMDTYSSAYHLEHEATLVEVNFLGEGHGGERLELYTNETEPRCFTHAILRADKAAPVCRARIRWELSARKEESPTH